MIDSKCNAYCPELFWRWNCTLPYLRPVYMTECSVQCLLDVSHMCEMRWACHMCPPLLTVSPLCTDLAHSPRSRRSCTPRTPRSSPAGPWPWPLPWGPPRWRRSGTTRPAAGMLVWPGEYQRSVSVGQTAQSYHCCSWQGWEWGGLHHAEINNFLAQNRGHTCSSLRQNRILELWSDPLEM